MRGRFVPVSTWCPSDTPGLVISGHLFSGGVLPRLLLWVRGAVRGWCNVPHATCSAQPGSAQDSSPTGLLPALKEEFCQL